MNEELRKACEEYLLNNYPYGQENVNTLITFAKQQRAEVYKDVIQWVEWLPADTMAQQNTKRAIVLWCEQQLKELEA